MADKRRTIDLLPSTLRTDDLRKFFSATVDQLFQPGRADPLAGYIGRYPDYYNGATDFYIPEPTLERYAHQLEPTMVSVTDTAIARVLFYSDLVNHLRANGAIDTDHSRMFENDYYSWAPPVDLDKLNNFQSYYWFTHNLADNGDVVEQPVLDLAAPMATYVGDGSTTQFALPPVVTGLTFSDEAPAIFVNGVAVLFTRVGNNLLISTPGPDAIVEVYRYGDLRRVIVGKANVRVKDLIDEAHPARLSSYVDLTTGTRITMRDAVTREPEGSQFVDGVGTAIVLHDYPEGDAPLDPVYTTINRRSRDGNGWARHNRWVHKAAFSWAKDDFRALQAKRPIVEFNADTELYNYGRRQIEPVDLVLSGPANYIFGWDTNLWDEERWEEGSISLAEINGKPIGSVSDDNFEPLEDGDRVLITTVVPGFPQFSHRVVEVNVTTDDEGIDVIVFIPDPAPLEGDIVKVNSSGVEYFFKGEVWVKGQQFSPAESPIFALYDVNGVALDDPTIYPDSDFLGNKLFGYADGVGRVDSVMGQALKYDKNGEIVFENHLASRRYAYRDGEVKGFYFFRRFGDLEDSFLNDWHFVDTPSRQTKAVDDVFTIPSNLQANPNNEQVTFIARGQWFEHFNSIMEAQESFEGVPYSNNNWRDTTQVLNLGTRILQHRSPLLKAMLLASDLAYDYMDAVRFAEQEYARFRSRFAQKVIDFYNDGRINPMQEVEPTAWVELVLKAMKANKSSDFAFALSSVGGGQNFIPPTPASMGLLPVSRPALVIDATYSEPVTFLRGHDGSRSPIFGERRSFEFDGTTDVVLSQDPQGRVVVRVDGVLLDDADYSQMGRLIRLETSIDLGATVLIEVEDVRDQAILALEQKIYDGIVETFALSEESYLQGEPLFRLDTWVEGKFRAHSTEKATYSRVEFDRILAPLFLRWAQTNQFDHRTNVGYRPDDAFTWNYSHSVDRDGDAVPGNWRGIYRWYFDTDRPHVAPWEMLGFANEPDWWEAEYGEAPFTSENTTLWHDLRDGVIRHGARQGTDTRYARPDLMAVLPVDETGTLLDPIAAHIILTPPTDYAASQQWAFGDHAPIENLWRNSAAFTFALAKAAFLMKPARWIEAGWDTLNNRIVHADQLIYASTGNRPKHTAYSVHGERDEEGNRVAVLGVQQWVGEHLISKGQDPEAFGEAVRGLDVRLAHRVAGFTTTDNLRILADNFGLVPEENVEVVLYECPSLREEFYSGVIIEWSGSGWRVIGYDATNPVFPTIPGNPEGPSLTVRLSDLTDEPIIVEWKPNVYFKADTLVDHKGSTYRALRSHTSTSRFEADFWEAEPGIVRPIALRVEKYLDTLGAYEEVPYGTEFNSVQEVASFLFNYERYLLSRGWSFDERDSSTGVINDWTAAVREFLHWTQVDWSAGNFIALSPGAETLKFSTDHGMVYNLEQTFKGIYGIVDRSGMPINRRDTFVTRLDGETTLTVRNADLFGVRLSVGEVEHALVFSNETIFGDIIYQPLLDLRQPRLRLIGQRSQDWKGRFDAPGYVLIDNQIKSNFDKSAEDIRNAFEIEGSDNKVLRDHARHLMGYESRDYFENLVLSDTEQFEFFQGMIKQKGAPDVFNKLLRSSFVGQERDLVFNEEWAFKAASYGALEATQRAAFDLGQSSLKREPQLVRFVDTGANNPEMVRVEGNDFLEVPFSRTSFFPRRETRSIQKGDMPTAGYVRLSEVDHTLFHLDDLADVYAARSAVAPFLAVDERIWVYDADQTWTVLRSTNASVDGDENRVTRVEVPDEDNTLTATRVYFERAHGFSASAIGLWLIVDAAARSEPDIEGLQKIVAVGDVWVDIEANCAEGYDWSEAEDPESAPRVLVLRPVRFSDETFFAASAIWFEPKEGELAYVDVTADGWKVFRWDGVAWRVHRTQPYKMDTARIASALIYDKATVQTSGLLNAEPLVLDHLVVYDPVNGIIPGVADREISFKVEFDPARYNFGAEAGDDAWGADHVGALWWDVSAVRFLEAETDDLPAASNAVEVDHRAVTWGKIAPGTSIDIYEWTRSLTPPTDWKGEGTPYLPNSWSETQESDANLNRLVTVYYFWVKGASSITSGAKGRRIPAATVARIIEHPSSFDLPWIAPIAPDCFVVSGVSQFLNDTSTVMQIEIDNLPDYDGVVHTEWTLMQKGDQLPPDYLWHRMIDSTAGMNVRFQSVPDPALHPTSRQGIAVRPRQSLFSGSQHALADTVVAARESLVGVLNAIMARAERPGWYAALTGLKDTWQLPLAELTNKLFWSDASSSRISLPSPLEYDYEVSSIEERDELVQVPDIRQKPVIRVFVNRMNDVIPQWSVWEYTVATGEFALAQVYDEIVDTMAERNALRVAATPLPVGHRVMVHDTGRGFWGLFRHDPEAGGWAQLRLQSFDTTPFVSEVDWYAEGYSATTPPIVRYATMSEFAAAEADAEKSTFVHIDNDGSGRWIWKVPDGSTWKTVAREKATVSLSSAFFDATRARFGLDGVFNLADVGNRDGGTELRALLKVFRTLLSDEEVNELFFSMVHFAHAHQDQINWAFKTSFMHVTGFNEHLEQTPVQRPDNIAALISYVNEVKPYRVKARDFSRTLTPPTRDEGTVSAWDFDKPRYFDNATNSYRVLKPTVPADVTILSTDPRYKPWFENYLKTGTDLDNYDVLTWNPIRRVTTKLIFDRIDGVKIANSLVTSETLTLGPTTLTEIEPGLVVGAASKITAHYEPTETMAEKNIAALMDLHFRGVTLDGDKIANPMTRDVEINGLDMSNANVTANAITLAINQGTTSRAGLGLNDPYWDDNRPEELIVAGHHDNLMIAVQERGRPGAPEQEFKLAETTDGTVSFLTLPQNKEAVMVWRDGLRAHPSAYTVDCFKREVVVGMTHPDGAPVEQVNVHVFGVGSTTDILETGYYVYQSGPKTFPIENTGAVEVVVQGVPTTGFTVANCVVSVTDTLTAGDQVAIVVRKTAVGLAPEPEPVTVRSVGFVFSGTRTFTIPNPSHPVSGPETTIVEVDGKRLRPVTDYAMTGSTLAIAMGVTMTSGVSTVVVTTFQNASNMEMTTTQFAGSTSGVYTLSAAPKAKEYVWLTLNGNRVSSHEFNLEGDKIWFTQGHVGTDLVMVTTFTGETACLPGGFLASTLIPTKAVMRPFIDGDWDTQLWDEDLWDEGQSFLTAVVPSGAYEGEVRGVYHMDGGWEYAHTSPHRQGVLSQALLMPTANIQVMASQQSSLVFRHGLFAKPQPEAMGVAWVGGERVEYGFVGQNETTGEYTLGALRRGSKGTSIGEQKYRMQHTPGTGSRTIFRLDGAATDQVSVYVFDEDGVSIAQQKTVDYEVILEAEGVKVTFLRAPAANTTVLVYEPISTRIHGTNTRVMAVTETFVPGNTIL